MNTHDAHNKILNNGSQVHPKRAPLEKVIQIETCRECRLHSSSTWHDETKYKKNFVEVKEAVELMIPGCKVVEKIDQWINLGAFEVYHENQLLYSKKKSGLWPSAKAIAQRIKQYFDDYEGGKELAHYGAGPEVAYVPAKKKGETLSKTGMGFHQTSPPPNQRELGKTGDFSGTKANGDGDHQVESQNKESPQKQKVQEKAQDHDDKQKAQPEHHEPEKKPQEQPKVVDKEHHEDKVEDNSKDHHEDDASHKMVPMDEHTHKESGHEGETKHD